jgi:GH15 family glucan-1,4-alpha-glucosidase
MPVAPPEAAAYAPISDYGLIGDLHTSALVSRAGSIDWFCLPRFDSPSVFARILDRERGGSFRVSVAGGRTVRRRYAPRTNVLETTFASDGGLATLTDLMPVDRRTLEGRPAETHRPAIMRLLRCLSGRVEFSLECRPRFDYGATAPRIVLLGFHVGVATAGETSLTLRCSAPLRIDGDRLVSSGTLAAGETLIAVLAGAAAGETPDEQPEVNVAEAVLDETRRAWEEWAAACTYRGPGRDAVLRSALTLKALIYAPTGAPVAAPTTSLPERIGGGLNWDYRYTWIRDGTATVRSLFALGFRQEARAFLRWLDRTAGGDATRIQIMHGVGGERRLDERELAFLEGYRGSRPVRAGNAAHSQRQLDLCGDLLGFAAFIADRGDWEMRDVWPLLSSAADLAAERWRAPDSGIWESRAGERHHVYSKVMCWVALARAADLARRGGLPGPVARWERVRDEIRADAVAEGFDAARGAFVASYGSTDIDASVLRLPLVGFIAADDPRMRSTVATIERELTSPDGLVHRNQMHGPLGTEGAFVLCTLWLAENLALAGERERALELLARIEHSANELGLFAEQIDAATGELLGNFPQAFSHLAHINAALRLHEIDPANAGGEPAVH